MNLRRSAYRSDPKSETFVTNQWYNFILCKLELYVYFYEDNVTMYQFWEPLLL